MVASGNSDYEVGLETSCIMRSRSGGRRPGRSTQRNRGSRPRDAAVDRLLRPLDASLQARQGGLDAFAEARVHRLFLLLSLGRTHQKERLAPIRAEVARACPCSSSSPSCATVSRTTRRTRRTERTRRQQRWVLPFLRTVVWRRYIGADPDHKFAPTTPPQQPGVGDTPAFPTLRSQYPPQLRPSALGGHKRKTAQKSLSHTYRGSWAS